MWRVTPESRWRKVENENVWVSKKKEEKGKSIKEEREKKKEREREREWDIRWGESNRRRHKRKDVLEKRRRKEISIKKD